MKFSTSSLIIQSLLASISIASPIEKRSPKTLNLSFDVVKPGNKSDVPAVHSSSNSDNKRSESLNLYNQELQYLTKIKMGSNQQEIWVGLDTGSSNLWFPSSDAICYSNLQCKNYGSFDPSQSTTYHNLSTVLFATFNDGRNAKGYFAKDDYWFDDGTKLDQVQFGLMNQDDRYIGLMGVGLTNLEQTEPEYPNFPIALKNQGIIDKTAYSLFLNEPGSASGNILFGGVDTAKYDGDLAILDFANYTWIGVEVQSFTTPDGKTHDLKFNTALDSGTTYIILNAEIANPILDAMGIGSSDTVACSSIDYSQHLTFNFNGVSINLPYTSLFNDLGNDQCVCLIKPEWEGGSGNFFGDTFLQNAYVAYNLDTRKIGLAQANYNGGSNIVDFWF
ncbi:uncharacterized protein KGF55_003753 [Candida pseudojiufengensis]|uniref:uncharacterized protein n=1 Tax=Candida pseudojiufengensis TaxID=497109 RepID=UPI002224AB00|nr:uncharacterized protein KGF55_003753 [Candida pseudojiufengensis]KAI5962677.1 hypothetical protein KGF55_003753 [Candida pseudojiufengensis]